jgi:hypothetical protein
MKKLSFNSIARLGAAALLVSTAVVAQAHDSSAIKLTLQNTGFDPDATGSLISMLKSKTSVVKLSAGNLTPGQSYVLTVGDSAEASVIADKKGRVSATFSTKPGRSKALLGFDPRGQLVALRDGTNSVLEGVVSGPSEPSGIIVDERAKLARLSGTGEAEVRYQTLRDGRRFFTVKIERAEPGAWSLFVNGISRGEISVSGRQTTVVFDSAPNSPTRRVLDFDPRGQTIDVALDTNLVFTGRLQAMATNVNVASPSLTQTFIPSTGVDSDGTAKVKYRVDPNARRKFSVELEDVPTGAYELVVDNTVHGTINMVTTSGGTEGEIEFSSRDDDGDELPLLFEPTTATFVVRSGGVVYFEGKLGGASGGSTGGNSGGGSGTPSGNGSAPDSFAGLTFNLDDQQGGDLMQFNTATSGVDLGTDPDPFSYVLTRLSSSQVRLDLADGDKLDVYVFTFSSATAGSWVRDEYRDSRLKDRDTGPFTIVAGTPVSGTGTGGGSTNPPGTNVVIFTSRIEVPLFSLGVSSRASAKAEFKNDDRGRRSFEVEIEDAPVGSYALIVGDTQVGTISVTTSTSGTHGEIEFEDDDDGDHLPLSFNPLGKLITLRRDGVDYFRRVFPTTN